MTPEVRRYLRLAGTPVTLVLLVVILVVAFKVGWKQLTAPPASARIQPCVNQNVGKALKTSDLSLVVLNGGHQHGLASTVGKQLKAKGFTVTGVGNTDERIKATIIVGYSKTDPEVRLVQGFFPKSTIREDKTRVDHAVKVLVGETYAGFNAKAPTSIAVSGPVCLPSPSPTPSATATPSK